MSSLLRAARTAGVFVVAVGALALIGGGVAAATSAATVTALIGGGVAAATSAATVTPVAPVFLDGACATDGADARVGEIIADTDGVQYLVQDAAGTVAVGAGLHPEDPATEVTVLARATGDNTLADGAVTVWRHSFAAEDCDNSSNGDDDTDTAPAPGFIDATCAAAGIVVIPDVDGLQYAVAGRPVAAGRHPVAVGDVRVTVTDQGGRTLVGTTSWAHRFAAAGGCPSVAPTEQANGPSSAPRPAAGRTTARPALAATGGPLPVGPALLIGLGLIGTGFSLVRLGRVA